MKKRTFLSWSSGKDSAWALHVLRQQTDIDVVGLFCTFNQAFERVAMHGVRIELVRQQAESVGLPIQLIPIPDPCSDAEYAAIMKQFVEQAKGQAIDCFAFGDLLLEDVRSYREDRLADTGITPLFPLWGRPTEELSQEMVRGGLRAIITCVDPRHLPADFAGQEYNGSFLERIPDSVDPCGENGEFHTFAFDGPMFQKAVDVTVGDTVSRDGFVFTDLLPGQAEAVARVQAIVVRDGRLLMVKHRQHGEEWWCLPGGAQEADETPEQGALRELREECNVRGMVVRQTSYASEPHAPGTYSFLVDIGHQHPSLGHDPEVAEGQQAEVLVDVQWLRLSEIPERDRAFVWAAGLLSVEDFLSEVESWGSDTSYPGEGPVGETED